ncbi:MAG TPA: bifunctional nuclease family protein [Nitrospira sp.]|nr:bifunctional nuclease family protein [Nitrospira sp.]
MMKIGMLTLSIFFCSVVLSQSTLAGQQESVPTDPVTITKVEVRLSDHGPVVLLQAEGKAIPIFVDMTVAVSIQGALKGEKLPRPLSHDLMHAILQTFGGKVTQTVITLKGGTYYGALSVNLRDDVKTFDSRSSDSIALAIHFNAPIIVGRDLLNSAGQVLEKSKAETL